ncbi:hypothetical protein HGG72_24755 [Ochrobactrum pecoris]|nr:hypothetical protein [Brucella pecoris]
MLKRGRQPLAVSFAEMPVGGAGNQAGSLIGFLHLLEQCIELFRGQSKIFA